MAISLSDNDPRVRYTATSGQTVFAVPFEFFDNDDFDVFEEDTSGSVTQKTLTTDYTVTGGSGSTGSITFGTGITLNHIITIVRNIDIERVTDFTGGAAINRAALNEQLDKLTAITSDIKDVNTRTVRLADWDADATLTLPSVANRADKLLGFDSSGNISTASADLTVDSLTIAYSGTPGDGTFLRANTDEDSRIVSENGVLILQSNKGSGVGKVLLDGNASPYVVDITATGGGTRLVSGDVLVDSSGDITLDADGGEIYFKDGGTDKFTFRISAAGNRILADSATTIETSAGAISMKAALGYVDFLTNGGAQSIQLQSTTTPEIRFYQNSNTLDVDVATLTGTRTLTLPDATDTLVGKATTDTLTNKTLTNPTVTDLVLNNNITGSAVLDQDDMSSNSATKLATQQSIKAYVDSQVASVPQGDITGVTAGTGLTGGGLSGNVTLNINATTGLTATSSTLSIDGTVVTLTGSQTLSNKSLTSPTLNGSIGGSSIKDEDNMVSNSAIHLATQQSIKAYVDAQVAGGGAGNLSTVLGIGNTTAGNNIVFGDSSGASDDRLVFGDGTDLSIYHDGSHSYIDEQGTGSLQIKATNLNIKSSTNETYIACVADGQVELNYDNSTKLATTSSGVDVTGTLTADGLTVDGDISVSDISPSIALMESDTTDLNTFIASSAGDFSIFTRTDAGINTKARFNIDHSTGDISFYEDTGTTAKLFWDASAERLGIGTTSPLLPLHVSSSGTSTASGGNAAVTIRSEASGRSSTLQFSDGTIATWIGQVSGSNLNFGTDNTERMRIDSSGNVGIGTSSPVAALQIKTQTNGNAAFQNSTSVTGGVKINAFNDAANASVPFEIDGSSLQFNIASTEAMRIDASGNLLVGTTDETLVGRANSARLCVDNIDGKDGIQIKGSGSNHLNIASYVPVAGSAYHIGFGSGTSSYTEHGVISTNGSTTTYGTSSDYRLKENVVDLTEATNRLKQLKPKRFNFIGNPDITVDGFLAHEAQSVVSEAVIGEKDGVNSDGSPKYQHIDQSKLVPLLVATIKELEARITALEAN